MGQFQVQMEECLLSRDSSHLVSVLQYEGLTNTTLTKLNQLVTKVTSPDSHQGKQCMPVLFLNEPLLFLISCSVFVDPSSAKSRLC